jgi:hypothetical protein
MVTVRGGKVVRTQVHASRDEALQAAAVDS